MKIPVTYKKFIFYSEIDNEDAERVLKINWSIKIDGNRLYAQGRVNMKVTSLHRFIMNAKEGQLIDHVNGNGLYNRKSNLRFCTRNQNAMNTPKRSWNTTGFKGVTRHGNKFRASIWDGNKRKYLGLYKTAKEAAIVYNLKAFELHGSFAYLNAI